MCYVVFWWRLAIGLELSVGFHAGFVGVALPVLSPSLQIVSHL